MAAAIRRAVAAMPLRFVGARTFAAHAVQVPSLGDSVPNGTILTLGKTPGQAVQVDDVIAVIETDKVTVDIRAEVGGVMTKYSVAEGDDVDVGAEIGVIDTEGEATAAPTPAPAPAPAPSPSPAPSPAPAPSPPPAPAHSSGSHDNAPGRKPLIQFRHGRANQQAAQPQSRGSAAAAAAAAAPEWTDGGLEFAASKATESADDLPSFFGRPVMSEREMEAVLMGGEA